jgi:CNT family concentrative nucleoside transporter
MGLRGPPALATAATVFMGQVEGPIFIRSYLPSLTRSELFMLIAVGMSCVSGSTMVAYATILKDVLPNAAAHVLTASIISAPAGVLLARILCRGCRGRDVITCRLRTRSTTRSTP